MWLNYTSNDRSIRAEVTVNKKGGYKATWRMGRFLKINESQFSAFLSRLPLALE